MAIFFSPSQSLLLIWEWWIVFQSLTRWVNQTQVNTYNTMHYLFLTLSPSFKLSSILFRMTSVVLSCFLLDSIFLNSSLSLFQLFASQIHFPLYFHPLSPWSKVEETRKEDEEGVIVVIITSSLSSQFLFLLHKSNNDYPSCNLRTYQLWCMYKFLFSTYKII